VDEEQIDNNLTEGNDTIKSTEKTIRHKTKREISDRLRFRILMRDGFTCK